jgi:hypothetical protein
MAIQDVLAAEIEGADTDETGSASTSETEGQRGGADPFSMEWDTDDYSIDQDSLNNVLTALVAVTNLI